MLVFLLGVVGFVHATLAQSVETPAPWVLESQQESQSRANLRVYEQVLDKEPANYAILQKAAYLHYLLGWLYSIEPEKKAEKKEHYSNFFDYANRAKQINPRDYQTSVLLAGAKAKMAAYLSRGDQVRIARELTQDVHILTDRKDDDPQTIYLASWLNFKIGLIPLPKKILASVLYGGLPDGMSVENAILLLRKAIAIKPDYIVYQYDMGLYYQRIGLNEKATVQFVKVLSMPEQSPEGIVYKRLANARLKEVN